MTTTDARGRFHFDDVPCDTVITLTATHAGIPLTRPRRVEPANDKPVPLQIGHFDFASIAGRVVDRKGSVVPEAEVVIQLLQAKQTIDCLRLRTDLAGGYETPAWFPRFLEYRVVVRSMCQDIASTAPRIVASRHEPFPDLVIDRPKPSPSSKLTGTEVVALVNREAITASDILERWRDVPLMPAQMTLTQAKKEMDNGLLSEAEYRELQDEAIRRFARRLVDTCLMAQAFWEPLPQERRKQVDDAIAKMFEQEKGRLRRDYPAWFPGDFEAWLRRQGTSLDGLRKEFRLKLIEQEYLRQWDRTLRDDPKRVETFYQEHLARYSFPEQVRWQLLRISFAERGGKDRVLAAAKDAAAALERGSGFGSVVRKYSDGPPPPGDDSLAWRKVDSPQNQEFAAAIDLIAAGDILPAFDRLDNWGAVRLPSAKQPVFFSEPGKFADRVISVTPPKPREVISTWTVNLRERENFDRASQNYFDDAGIQPWTNPASIVDLKLALALAQLEPGATSPVIEGSDSFFIVRLIERRPAGHRSQNEVAASIRQEIRAKKKEQMLEELFERATIESPYLPDKANTAAGAYWTNPPAIDLIDPAASFYYRDLPERARHRHAS